MSLASRALARAARLPPPLHRSVLVERDLPMAADDGAVLLADRWWPAGADPRRLPVVLMRSPYGRRPFGSLAEVGAERGYQVVVQSCRGTFGSGGAWEPFRHEQADGRRCLAWLAEQPWWGGAAGTAGPSYLGLTQWALFADRPPWLRAAALHVTASRFRDIVVYPGGTFALETGATWLHLLDHQEGPRWQVAAAQLRAWRGALTGAYTTLPLSQADTAVLGHPVGHYQDWLAHERPGDRWWDPVDFGRDPSAVPPATLVGGWWDIFLPAQVADFEALRAAGREARLTVGPWTHNSPRGGVAALADGLDWMDTHLRDQPPRTRRAPVRLWVIGGRRWAEAETWPPPHLPTPWYLHGGGRLSRREPEPSAPTRYRFDPADPTPGVGGPSLDPARAGKRDQRRRESRADVATWTSDPLPADLTAAGPVEARVWLRSSVWWTDVFVRLCTVNPTGKSVNLSDGILRLEPDGGRVVTPASRADGEVVERDGDTVAVRIRMWPTAVTWRKGHRIRLQVSGGAHPLFARNLGGGERLGPGTRLVAADHEVLHDPAYPSLITLPHSAL